MGCGGKGHFSKVQHQWSEFQVNRGARILRTRWDEGVTAMERPQNLTGQVHQRSIHLSICPLVYPSFVYQFIHQSNHPVIQSSIQPFIQISITGTPAIRFVEPPDLSKHEFTSAEEKGPWCMGTKLTTFLSCNSNAYKCTTIRIEDSGVKETSLFWEKKWVKFNWRNTGEIRFGQNSNTADWGPNPQPAW